MSWARVGKGVVITIVVAVLCFLPPIVHLITGPLSPLIGGYLAGTRACLRGGEAFFVGVVLALAIGVPAPWLLRLPYFGHIRIETAALIFLSVFCALWFGVLGGVAAGLGGAQALKEEQAHSTHHP